MSNIAHNLNFTARGWRIVRAYAEKNGLQLQDDQPHYTPNVVSLPAQFIHMNEKNAEKPGHLIIPFVETILKNQKSEEIINQLFAIYHLLGIQIHFPLQGIVLVPSNTKKDRLYDQSMTLLILTHLIQIKAAEAEILKENPDWAPQAD
jgi:hypothetical protein